MTFAERLKHYRELAGYKTGKEFAEHLNIPYPSYMAYENRGREPKYELLIKIANILNVTTDELLGNKQTELQIALAFCKKNGFCEIPISKMEELSRKHNLLKEDECLTESDVYLIDSNFYDAFMQCPEKPIVEVPYEFEKETVDRDMIMEFTCQFIQTVNAVRDYILDPDGILLAPEYIYVKEGRYKFCYLPMSYRCLKNSFHEMTEFFVKKLDYRDTEGIFLAYILHRSTLQEEYDLRAILDEYISEEKKRREEQKQKEDISDGTIFTVEDEGEEAVEKIYTVRPDDPSAMEEKKRYGPIRKMIGKIRTGRWGNWQDLITEIDGQDIDGHL